MSTTFFNITRKQIETIQVSFSIEVPLGCSYTEMDELARLQSLPPTLYAELAAGDFALQTLHSKPGITENRAQYTATFGRTLQEESYTANLVTQECYACGGEGKRLYPNRAPRFRKNDTCDVCGGSGSIVIS